MFVYTESGSIYAIDKEKKQARRNYGTAEPTKLVGAFEWRKYTRIDQCIVGMPMVIVWDVDDPGITAANSETKFSCPATITSNVTHIKQ